MLDYLLVVYKHVDAGGAGVHSTKDLVQLYGLMNIEWVPPSPTRPISVSTSVFASVRKTSCAPAPRKSTQDARTQAAHLPSTLTSHLTH